jgi:hypothetical protein
LQAKKTICCTDLLALKPSKDEKHAAPGSGIATMSPAVGRVMAPIACAIIFQAPGNNDVYYFQLHPYAVFFLRSLLLPEFRSNTCDRIPPSQQLKKESRKSCPTNHKPHNRGLNLRSAWAPGGGGLWENPSTWRPELSPGTPKSKYLYDECKPRLLTFFFAKKRKKSEGKQNKNLRNRTRKRCIETEKHQPSEKTNLSRSSPPGETTKAAGLFTFHR